jgi:hypothetical protein
MKNLFNILDKLEAEKEKLEKSISTTDSTFAYMELENRMSEIFNCISIVKEEIKKVDKEWIERTKQILSVEKSKEEKIKQLS